MSSESRRGREAHRPRELGKRGWWDTLKRVKAEISRDNVGIIAAGVAFYAFLALVPTLTAIVSIWGLFASPEQAQSQLMALEGVLPASAQSLVTDQLTRVAGSSSQALGWGVALSVLLALWGANKGMKAIITATNIAYDQEDERGFFRKVGLSLVLTLGAIVMTIVLIGVIVSAPVVLSAIGLGDVAATAISILRWPVVAALVIASLMLLYRWSPDRSNPKWQWVLPGAILATIGWLGLSAAFSFYVSNFGSYNETYGALGGVVVLMLWFWLSAFVVLIGAELNSESEAQTRVDTTSGRDRPMGERGARKADQLGESPA